MEQILYIQLPSELPNTKTQNHTQAITITTPYLKIGDARINYKNDVKLRVDSGINGDAASRSDLGNMDYTKLLVGYEDGYCR